jgi:hypothetical protein
MRGRSWLLMMISMSGVSIGHVCIYSIARNEIGIIAME